MKMKNYRVNQRVGKVAPGFYTLAIFMMIACGLFIAENAGAEADIIQLDKFEAGDNINSIAWPRGSSYLSIASGKKIHGWNFNTDKTVEGFTSTDYIRALSTDIEGKKLAGIGWDKKIRVWRIMDGQLTRTMNMFPAFQFADAIALDAKGQYLATGDCEGNLSLYDLTANAKLWKSKVNDKCVTDIAFEPNGRYLAAVGDDNKIKIYDYNGVEMAAKAAHSKGISSIVFAFSGDEFYTSGKDGKVCIWTMDANRKIQRKAEFKDHKKAVNRIAVTSDSRFLISGGSDGVIYIRDLVSGTISGEIRLKSGTRITALALSGDGRYLAYGGTNQSVKVADLYKIENFVVAYSAPCDLVTTVSFNDTETFDPNNVLDGAETEGYLTTTTKNNGAGSAYGIKLNLECDNSGISPGKTSIDVGMLYPGEAVTHKWPLSVDKTVKSGMARFLLSTSEGQGRDAPRVELPVHVAALTLPKFEILREEWNDGLVGAADGNNNGIPENGETIELIAYFANEGGGRGRDVTASLTVSPANLVNMEVSKVNLGDIDPGEKRPISFIFSLPRDFPIGQQLTYDIRINDQRGVASLDHSPRPRQIEVNRPLLTADITSPASVSNGDVFNIRFTPKNTGGLAAKDVRFQLTPSRNIMASVESGSIGKIDAGQRGLEREITFTVPRNYLESQLSFSLHLSDGEGFSVYNDTVVIGMDIKRPRLSADVSLSGTTSSNSIVRAAAGALQVTVKNAGNLDAEDVRLMISTDRRLVNIEDKVRDIGRIPAGNALSPMTFPINVPRGEQTGPMIFTLNFTQEHFDADRITYEVEILADEIVQGETPAIIETDIPQGGGATLPASGTTKPTIVLMPDKTVDTVWSDSYTLPAMIANASNGINKFDITLNGKKRYDRTDDEVQSSLSQTGGTTISLLNLSLPMREGENKLIVTVMDSKFETESKTIRILYIPPRGKSEIKILSDVDAGIEDLGTGKRHPNRCAVIIGIEDYLYATNADYAKHDAQVFAEYAQHVFGIDKENIYEYYDEKASFFSLKSIFEDYSPLSQFLRKHGSNAEIFFYYSGHGIPIIDDKSKKAISYLLPYDVAPSYNAGRSGGLPVSDIYSKLRQHNPRAIFVALDACFTGSDKMGRSLSGDRPGLQPEKNTLDGTNEVSFTATSDQETAGPYRDENHGLFTYYLLKALRGEADKNGNREITINEISEYIGEKVPQEASKSQRKQTPQVSTGDSNRVLFETRK